MSSVGNMFAHIHDPSARVRALCEYGCKVDVDQSIPPKRYLRSGLEMMRMANVYYQEKNLESAFILYSKFVTLFVEKLPKHPEFKVAPQAERARNKKKCMEALDSASTIKKRLVEIYTKEEELRQAVEKRRLEELANQEAKRLQELEKQRQEEEEKRRIEEEQKLLILQNKEKQKIHEGGDNDLSGALDKNLQLDNSRTQIIPPPYANQAEGIIPNAPAETFPQPSVSQEPFTGPVDFNDLPPPPSYSSVVPSAFGKHVLPPVMPSRDLKKNILAPAAGAGLNSNSVIPAIPDRGSKPSLDHFTSVGETSSTNRFGLKDIVVPADLVQTFIKVAQVNTSRNVETCGILSGKLSYGAFKITHLLIPKQSGTSDSCATEGEEALFDYQDNHDLITLGWIHTHPSQTAFLSSVDLHTHCSYQLMMPEAIAIVYSPKFQETGIFYLTPDHGLNYIADCRQAGFHPHPKDPALFEEAPHAKIDAAANVVLVDLRQK